MDLRGELQAAGYAVIDVEPLGGGCISEIYHIRLADGESLVAKIDEQGGGALDIEAYMLQYLSTHTRLPVPAVIDVSDGLLLLEYITGGSFFNERAERHAAELMAQLHGISSLTYGFERDTLIGGLPQPNQPTHSWVEFFKVHRLLFMAKEAMMAGRLPTSLMSRIESLADHLDDYLFEPVQAALIHGDAWTTNILASGDRITAFLDPAIYFAHNEIELAFTTLFHTFGHDFFEEYRSYHPIEPGFFEERRDLYNLYPLLVHVRLFGGSYISSVDRTLARFGY